MTIRIALLALLSACQYGQYCEGDWAAVPAETKPSTRQARVVAQVLPVESKAVDILFVIDDSGSMTDQQAQLGIWSKEMFSVLSGDGELPDLHIGVTSSSVAIPGPMGCENGTGGMLTTGAVVASDRFLSDVAGPEGRVRNYEGTLTDAFAKMARVGDAGCGYEQPFKAARLALASEGFLRDDALLLVVFVTDEDDCSSADPAFYADPYGDACSDMGPMTSYRCFEHGVECADGKGSREFGERTNCRPSSNGRYIESVPGFAQELKKLKPHPAQTLVAGIYGKPNGVFAIPDETVELANGYQTPRLADVCGGNGVEGTGATPAIRMNALLAEFGGRASQSSICESELSWAMRDVGLVAREAATRSHCLRGALVDTDAVAPGVQPACKVTATTNTGTSREVRRDVPFTLELDTSCAGHQLSFRAASLVGETLTVTCDVDDGSR